MYVCIYVFELYLLIIRNFRRKGNYIFNLFKPSCIVVKNVILLKIRNDRIVQIF